MLALLVCAGGEAAEGPTPAPVSVSDDLGRTVRLAGPARRIVSLAPHATELLYAIGAGDRVVAVDRSSDHPAAARALPSLAVLPRPDLERLLVLKPDLVVVWKPGMAADLPDRLARHGIPVFVTEVVRFDAIADTLRRLGELTARQQAAGRLADAVLARTARLRDRDRAPVPVFVQVWPRPLMTLSDQDLIGDALRLCGARNLFGDLPHAAAQVDPEAVLRRGPRLIIGFDDVSDVGPWQRLGALHPVGNIRWITVDRVLQRPTLRALDALEKLCADIAALRGAG